MGSVIGKFGWLALIAAGGLLFYAGRELPRMGDPQSPASVHVSPRYIEKAQEEAGAPNMVTAVLADYRSYDTLGETVVIFTAGLACLLVLGTFRQDVNAKERMMFSFGSDVLDAMSRLLTPFIVLFASYVVIHGHTSPGGGFSRRGHLRGGRHSRAARAWTSSSPHAVPAIPARARVYRGDVVRGDRRREPSVLTELPRLRSPAAAASWCSSS